MQFDEVPIAVVAFATGQRVTTASENATAGVFGPTRVPDGYVQKRVATRKGVEQRLGPIPDEVWAKAWARYLNRGADFIPILADARIVMRTSPGEASIERVLDWEVIPNGSER